MAHRDDRLATSTEDEIDRFLDDWIATENIPGGSVAVFDADGVLYATGLGARTLDGPDPATPDTLYNAGSITKITTAIALLQLVEQDRLALDDAVADYVSVFSDAPGDPITIHELLSHTSGIPSDALYRRDNIATQRDLQLHINGVARDRVTDDPPFMYSNSGYKILGELIATVDGRPYSEYIDQEILTPLGMERSTFDQSILWDDEDAMIGYLPDNGDRVPADEPLTFPPPPAEGGLISSVTELTRLLRCLLTDGTLDGTQILAPESVTAMMEQHAHAHSTIEGDDEWYGYGVEIEPFLGEVLVGHGGNVGRSLAYVGGLADHGLGVALAVNTGGVLSGAYARGVLALAADENPEEEVPRFALQEKLETVAGSYEAYRGPTATVEAQDGHITIDIGGMRDEQYPAFPTSLEADDYTFYAVRGNGLRESVEFRETEAGLMLLESRFRFTKI